MPLYVFPKTNTCNPQCFKIKFRVKVLLTIPFLQSQSLRCLFYLFWFSIITMNTSSFQGVFFVCASTGWLFNAAAESTDIFQKCVEGSFSAAGIFWVLRWGQYVSLINLIRSNTIKSNMDFLKSHIPQTHFISPALLTYLILLVPCATTPLHQTRFWLVLFSSAYVVGFYLVIGASPPSLLRATNLALSLRIPLQGLPYDVGYRLS